MTHEDTTTLLIHYYFNDDSHSMNAFIKNKADQKLFLILQEMSDVFNLDFEFEVTAIHEGGIKDLIKIKPGKKTKKFLKKYGLTTYTIVGTVLGTLLIHEITTDDEYQELKKQDLKLEIQKKQLEVEKLQNEKALGKEINDIPVFSIEEMVEFLFAYDKIKNIRSDYYIELQKIDKLNGISNDVLNDSNQPMNLGKYVSKEKFNDLIIYDREIEPLIYDDIKIDIISPVLNQGNYKWRGVIHGYQKSFNMKDKEFKKLILQHKITFETGTSIMCKLIVRQKVNNHGKIETIEHNVFNVRQVLQSDNDSLLVDNLKD
jgi:hypothetical protein